MTPRSLAGLMAVVALAGCPGANVSGKSLATSSGSSSGSTTGGNSTGTSGVSSSVAAGTTGTSSGGGSGTSAGTSSGGSSTGAASCGPGLVWVGDQCRSADCRGSPIGAACLLPQGGIGICSEMGCAAVNLQTDPSNCGLFGLSCPPPTVCVNGACFDPASGPPSCDVDSCGPQQVCFPGFGCVLLYSYCGEFGTEGQACIPPYDNDRPGTCCADGCDRIDEDRYNCGRCGVSCSGGCGNGICYDFVPVTCNGLNNGSLCSATDAGFVYCCDGACGLPTDGGCGCETACPIGSSCLEGYCLEPGDAGLEASCGSSSDCPAGYGCWNGGCLTTVCGPQSDNEECSDEAGGLATCCNGACADLSSDPKNCGLCGLACGQGQLCVDRSCVSLSSACQNGSTCALTDGSAGICCGSTCVDSRTDPENCGGCGEACPIGSKCTPIGEAAFCSPDGGAFATCAEDSDCPEGLSCSWSGGLCGSYACDAGSARCLYDAGGTPAFGTCCGMACVGGSDSSNCGLCNEVCPVGASCDQGYCSVSGCGSCPPGTACVLYYGEYTNCFPATCGPDSDGLGCAFGPNLFGTCCGGRCVNPLSDPAECGSCGRSCSSGVCYRGVCAGTPLSAPCAVSCGPGTICEFDSCISSDCNTVADACVAQSGTLGVCCPNGACAHLLDDPYNCGGCGQTCAPGQTCAAGTCSGSPACGPGQAEGFCNLDGGLSWVCCPGTGCTDTATDRNNCGACGAGCASGMACRSGVCG